MKEKNFTLRSILIVTSESFVSTFLILPLGLLRLVAATTVRVC
jgi:hypothetical protein